MHFKNLRFGFFLALALVESVISAVETDRDFTVVAAGDIAVCDALHQAESTARLVERLSIKTDSIVITLGDNSNNDGRPEEYRNCFEPTWGRFKDKIRPSPGNHDDYDERSGLGHGGAAYYDYFGEQAGPSGLGYYSFNLGRHWHLVSLNSEAVDSRTLDKKKPQIAWLKNDLNLNDRFRCTLAYFHRPMVSSGQFAAGRMRNLWEVMYAEGVDVVLNGHEHFYERFAPQDPWGNLDHRFGIRQFIVGTGGAGFHPAGPKRAKNSVLDIGQTFGAIVLTLRPNDYLWEFVDIHGVVRDSGVGECHWKPF